MGKRESIKMKMKKTREEKEAIAAKILSEFLDAVEKHFSRKLAGIESSIEWAREYPAKIVRALED